MFPTGCSKAPKTSVIEVKLDRTIRRSGSTRKNAVIKIQAN